MMGITMTDTDRSSESPEDTDKIILVVDEGWGLGKFIFAALKTEGPYRPLLAMDGSQALEMVNTVVPDLFVFHDHLSDIDGLELADRLQTREALKQIPILLLSTDGPKEAREQHNLVSLEIPFELDELLQTVQSLVGGSQVIHL